MDRALHEDSRGARASGASSGAASQSSARDDEENKALKLLQSEMKAAVPKPGTNTAAGAATAGSTGAAEGVTARTPEDAPTKVVKRITRRVGEDGKETTEIQFIVSEADVFRVERETAKQEHFRQRLRQGLGEGSDDDMDGGRRMTLQFGKLKNIVRI